MSAWRSSERDVGTNPVRNVGKSQLGTVSSTLDADTSWRIRGGGAGTTEGLSEVASLAENTPLKFVSFETCHTYESHVAVVRTPVIDANSAPICE